MNRFFIIVLLCLGSFQSTIQAQEFKFGVKGGVNKTFGGQLTGIASTAQYTGDTFNAEGEIGFHGGLWTQLSFGRFFIRPEVVYSKLESRFDFPRRPAIYAVDELSVPFLVGFNIWGPLDVYAGPAYKKVIESSLEGTEPPDQTIVVQNFPLSAQAGVKVEFGSFGLDVRYDHSLATEENQGVDIVNSVYGVNLANFEDARLHQLIVSLTIKLWDTENKDKRRRRGGSCYF
jgi:hypothetical protein